MVLNAVMCVWNEEDIIESNIKHLFSQGCSNVFIVDNCSTDKTVENAIKAGGKLIDRFESKYFDELQKIYHLNTVVKNYNEKSDEEYIWWLYVDSDEFPNIDGNLTILDFLKQLNSSVRCVHGYMFNHIPTHPPYHISPYHPADFQPICEKSNTSKIPLLRYDKGKPHLYSAGGAHTFDTCGDMIPVAKDVLQIHHFNYRSPENTINRLKQLCQKRSDGSRRTDRDEYMGKQISINSQSTYINRYKSLKSTYNHNKYISLMVDELQYNYKYVTRYQNINDLNLYNCSKYDILISQSIYHFFLEDYDLALCRFTDLLEIVEDKKLQLLIMIKIAQCLSVTNKNEALSLLKPALKCNNPEIRDYSMKQFERINDDKFLVNRDNDIIKYNIQNYYGEFDKKVFL